MKIRNGFVSNSSSSSFVVAFPRKPKSVDDVYAMMFDGKEGGIQPYDFVDGLSHTQIATRVWNDIESGTSNEWDDTRIPAKLKDIKQEFKSRYYYCPHQNTFWSGRQTDEKGGAWLYTIDKYFGSDKEVLNELRDMVIEIEKKKNDIQEKKHNIFKTEFKLKSPPYAFKNGIDSETGKKYTKKQISDYDKYQKALNKFRKENVEYAKLETELQGIWKTEYTKQHELEEKIANIDAKAFWKDYKNAFIVILSYSDNEGDSTLEHGDIFKNLPHVAISHH